MITGIEWVSEIIGLAGDEDVFPEFFGKPMAKQRIIADPSTVIEHNPDILLASWCGKMMKKEKIVSRPGWQNITAVKNEDIYEINSDIILQPGPAALLEGFVEKMAGKERVIEFKYFNHPEPKCNNDAPELLSKKCIN